VSVPTAPLGDLVTIIGGGTPRRDNDAYFRGDIPWVTPKDMKSWDIREAQINITEEAVANSATKIVSENSILIVVRSGVLKHSLPVALARRKVAINQDLKALRCGDRILPEFLARFLKHSQPEILGWVRATTADNFPIETLRELSVPLPPLVEQRRIAAILDQADDLRRKRREAIFKANSLASTILDQLLREADSNSSLKITQLDGLVRSSDRINYGVVQPGSDVEDGVPLIRVENVVDADFDSVRLKKISPKIEAQYKRSRLIGDEILVACVGSIGAIALAKNDMSGFNIARAVARIPVDPSLADRVYLSEILKTPRVQAYFKFETRAVAQPTLNIKQLCETPVWLPPLELQRAFAARVAEIDKLKAHHRAHLARLDALFASLQHRAFRGDLPAPKGETSPRDSFSQREKAAST
jgi:type I restriction enzyme S subunit